MNFLQCNYLCIEDDRFSNSLQATCAIKQDDLQFFQQIVDLFNYCTENLYDIYQQTLEEKDDNLIKVLNMLLEEVDETFKNSKYQSAIAECKKKWKTQDDLIPHSLCDEFETEGSSNSSGLLHSFSVITCDDDGAKIETEHREVEDKCSIPSSS